MKKLGRAVASLALAGAFGMGMAVPADAVYQRTITYTFSSLDHCRNNLQNNIKAINQLPDAWVISYKMCRKVKSTRGRTYAYTLTYGYGR